MSNISNRKIKAFEIRLQPASDKPDLTCADGEVESYRNVDWLKALEEASDKSSSAPAASKENIPTVLTLNLVPCGVELPYGSRLLAVHSPDALNGECRYLILTLQDTLAVYAPEYGLHYLPGLASAKFGDIRKAVAYGDFILIVASKGIGWVVFDPTDSSYSLSTGELAPPSVTFQLTPAALHGYSSTAGEWPELDVAVDIPADSGASQAAFQSWLESGIGNSVSEDIRQRVYQAVGHAVKQYARTVARRGLFLLPPVCIASFDDGILPTVPLRVAPTVPLQYSPPCARLLSWSFQSDILRLKVNFSLVPLSLSVAYSIPDEMNILGRRFRKLFIAASAANSWTIDGSNASPATGFTSFIDPSTGERTGFAFRFNSLSSEELADYSLADKSFRIIRRVSLAEYSSGTVLLPHPDSLPASEATSFSPDYRDFTLPAPMDAVAADTGFILFGGTAKLSDPEGNSVNTSLDSSILCSIPDYPFVFRHYCRVSDGSIFGATQSGRSRTASATGRHPLNVISSDGIRLLAASGDGGFLNSRLISPISPLRNFPIACNTDLLFFATENNIRSVSPSGTLTTYPVAPPEGQWEWMVTSPDNQALMLYSTAGSIIIDLLQNKTFPVDDITFKCHVIFESRIYVKRTSGSLLQLAITRSEEEPQEPAASLDVADSDISELAEANTALIVTRPLKFGSTHLRKRIRSVSVAHPAISFSIEGSDNLTDWTYLFSSFPDLTGKYRAGICGLHLPAFRFFRFTAETYIPLATHLASFTFTVES